jgi:transcriptional regulator with XRE-family HTH domain
MSMMFYGKDNLGSVRRLVWGRLFGQCVEKTRQVAGRSIAEAAQLAGMEASEWSAVEAGFVPDPAKLRPMADALELRYDRIATMAVLCRDAWERTGGWYSHPYKLTSRGRR